MRQGRQPGPSGIRVEDLRRWRDQACPAWDTVITLVQMAFRDGELPTAFLHSVLVLIPKPNSTSYRGIALLEVVYKLCATIAHLRLSSSISFHPCLHGFRPKRGTSTATLEAKLLMQLAIRSGHPLYQIFLDLTKAYDTLDRARTLDILRGYGVGPNICRLLQCVWTNDTLIPRSGGYFGTPIVAERGVRQGDVLSPIVFKIVIDCIVREWIYSMRKNNLVSLHHIALIFYADDGRLAGYVAPVIQQGLALLVELFARVGLRVNAKKTKAMITVGAPSSHRMSLAGYKRRMSPTASTRKRARVVCPLISCSKVLASTSLKNHLLLVHGVRKGASKRPAETMLEGKQHKTACLTCSICSERFTPQKLRDHLANIHHLTPPADEDFCEASLPQSYTISMPGHVRVPCPVRECPGSADTGAAMRQHFATRHVDDSICIAEEGQYLRCPRCGMFLQNITPRHLASQRCQIYATRCSVRSRYDDIVNQTRTIQFRVDGVPIERVSQFKYLGRWFDDDDADILPVFANIQKAQRQWGLVRRLLCRQGASRSHGSLLPCNSAVCSVVWLGDLGTVPILSPMT